MGPLEKPIPSGDPFAISSNVQNKTIPDKSSKKVASQSLAKLSTQNLISKDKTASLGKELFGELTDSDEVFFDMAPKTPQIEKSDNHSNTVRSQAQKDMELFGTDKEEYDFLEDMDLEIGRTRSPALVEGSLVGLAQAVVVKTATKTDASVKKEIFKTLFVAQGDSSHQVNVKFIAAGKAKDIWLPQDSSTLLKEKLSSKVFITAVDKGKEKEIRDEVGTCAKIIENYEKLPGHKKGDMPQHLAVDLLIKKGATVDGVKALVVETSKAKCDLEKFLQDPTLTMSQRLDIVHQVTKAMKELHAVGGVSGDLKLENFLVYVTPDGEVVVKMSDFGKTKLIGDSTWFYSGNTRFGPAEGMLSKAGDVSGLAAVIVRILEEPILAKTGEKMLPLDKYGIFYPKDRPPADSRRGIERYKVDNQHFNAFDTLKKNEKTGEWEPMPKEQRKELERNRRVKMAMADTRHLKKEQEQIDIYLDVLQNELSTEYPSMVPEIQQTVSVLRQMSASVKENRPTINEVAERLTTPLENAISKDKIDQASAAAKKIAAENAEQEVANRLVKPIRLMDVYQLGDQLHEDFMKFGQFDELSTLAAQLGKWELNPRLREKYPKFSEEVLQVFAACIQAYLALPENIDKEREELLEEFHAKIEAAADDQLTADQKALLYRAFESIG